MIDEIRSPRCARQYPVKAGSARDWSISEDLRHAGESRHARIMDRKLVQEFLFEVICCRFSGPERDAWAEWLARVAGHVKAKPPNAKGSTDGGVNLTFLYHWPGCDGANGPRRDN